MDNLNYAKIAKEVIEIQLEQINNLVGFLDEDFTYAINSLSKCNGKVIVCGMGKSGIVGKKIAATFSSTGTSSFFLHPGEAFHGDLGMIQNDDHVILISYSGETDEVLKIIPFLKNQGNCIISMTGNPNSTLAKHSDFHININVNREACPLKLAPTSSTTVTMIMGDAIAICLMNYRNFKEDDFAKYHPGGSLGKKLLLKVSDVMRTKNLPISNLKDPIDQIIYKITSGKLGVVVVTENDKILGIITDGDIRRSMIEKKEMFFRLTANELMTKNPKSIHSNSKLNIAKLLINKFRITSLLAVDDDGKLVGILQGYDID